jgi:hypothetical protein
LPRKTDSNHPGDGLFLAESDLEGVRLLAQREVGYSMCRSKLAELIRLGWFLEKTHDLQRLASELQAKGADLFGPAKPLCTALAELYFSDRYPGFDLEDPDWPGFRTTLEQVASLLERVKARVAQSDDRR